ncbi:hypothetical protein OnM2_097031 [Erysiphe neolycopersici]|uniref:Uncharacterized protein n=1 Tax=Erysiphe neolycopersici TaxID=212602 RepID=A0A420HAE3_9PEZI|nr:hypothetical protein OnM2_097031 [Erysiphe neolycopersici]
MVLLIIVILLMICPILYYVFQYVLLSILAMIGFTAKGIAAGSYATLWEASYRGYIAAGSLFSILQSIAALSIMTISHFLAILAQLPMRAYI